MVVVLDAALFGLMAILFGVSVAYVYACERLRGE